jgi:hypothetical protein
VNRSISRAAAATALVVLAPFALSACGTSFSAQTNQQYQAGVGANLRQGDLQVYNGLFVDNGDGTATFSGGLLARGDNQSLTSATITPKTGPAIDVTLSAPIELPGEKLVTLGTTAEILISDKAVTAGDYVKITFKSDTATAMIDVPVVARTPEYDSVARTAAVPAPAVP